MSKNHKRYFIKGREAKELFQKASKRLNKDLEAIFGAKASVELVEINSHKIFLINGKPALFEAEKNLYPTLFFEEVISSMPKTVMDIGAVPHVCNGANVMAPGIVRLEGKFKKGDFVVVVDENYGKPLAVGEVLYDDEVAREVRQGAVVKNVHYVGDKVWKSIRELHR